MATFNYLQKKTTQNMTKEVKRTQRILTVGTLLTPLTLMIKNMTQRASKMSMRTRMPTTHSAAGMPWKAPPSCMLC